MTTLFHRDIFLPAIVANIPTRTLAPRITRHAEEAAKSDRYGAMVIPSRITFSGKDVVEAEFVDGKLVKLVMRLSYDATRDAIFAVGFDNGSVFLKTAWFNLKSDKHATLKRHLYATK